MKNKWIHKIVRKLKCSKKKKEEIRKQLLSEIAAELETGETEQVILKRMGSPAEIAEEFNSSFSDEETKKYKKEKWIKRIGIVLLVIAIICAIVWWFIPKQIFLSDSRIFEEEIVLQQAKVVLDYVEEDNYEALKGISDATMTKVLEDDSLGEAKKQLGENWGERQSIGNVYAMEVTQMGKKSAIVQMHVQYENENIMFTILFDTDMRLYGLWMM